MRKKEYRKEKADINIRFAVGKHDRTEFDSDSFDGLGGTVGHAFFPRDGRLHFDDDEIWTINLKSNSKGDFSHERFYLSFNGQYLKLHKYLIRPIIVSFDNEI